MKSGDTISVRGTSCGGSFRGKLEDQSKTLFRLMHYLAENFREPISA